MQMDAGSFGSQIAPDLSEASDNPYTCCGIGKGGGKQGRGNQPPYRRYGPDTEIQYRPRSHTDRRNPPQFSPKGKPIRNFSMDPASSIRTRLRTPFFRTPFPRLLIHVVELRWHLSPVTSSVAKGKLRVWAQERAPSLAHSRV